MNPALRLVAACCRWPDDEVRRERIRDAAHAFGDWRQAASLAEAHRVEALVANGLNAAGIALPDADALYFRQLAERIRIRSLTDLAETLRVSEALGRASICNCILKGVPLGIAAYGTPALKWSWDIDVLVKPSDAVAAAERLAELGYAPELPARPLTKREFQRWSRVSKEAEFGRGDGSVIELHWRLSDYPQLLSRLDPWGDVRKVELIGGLSVATLGDAANAAYLAVHGATHGWSRLKWLADFAALVHRWPQPERRARIEQARHHSPGRALDQALVLSDRMLGTDLATLAQADEETERLVGLAMIAIESRRPHEDLDRNRGAKRAIARSHWLLAAGPKHRLSVLAQRLRGSEDRRLIPLPPGFQWSYWLIRPATALWRRTAKRRND